MLKSEWLTGVILASSAICQASGGAIARNVECKSLYHKVSIAYTMSVADGLDLQKFVIRNAAGKKLDLTAKSKTNASTNCYDLSTESVCANDKEPVSPRFSLNAPDTFTTNDEKIEVWVNEDDSVLQIAGQKPEKIHCAESEGSWNN